MSTLFPTVNSRRVVMSYPAMLFAPVGVGYDGSRVDPSAPQAGWIQAGAPARAEVRHTYQTRTYGARAGEPEGTRRVVNGRESMAVSVGFHEQDFTLFDLLFAAHRYGGGFASGPHVYAHRTGQLAECAALIATDNDDEAGGHDQTVWFFPHLVGTTGFSQDAVQVPQLYEWEAEAMVGLVGMPDGDQIYASSMTFHFTT